MIYFLIILLSLITQYTVVFLITYIKSVKRLSNADKSYDYIIVLGCPYNAAPGSQYQNRINKTAEYLTAHPDSKAILSGACVKSAQQKTESQYMLESLISLGISPDRLISEPNASSTYENLLFSDKIIKDPNPAALVGVLTNRYHLVRAAIIARSLNLNFGFIPANDPVNIIKAYLREYFVFPLTVINVYIKKNHK